MANYAKRLKNFNDVFKRQTKGYYRVQVMPIQTKKAAAPVARCVQLFTISDDDPESFRFLRNA
ncbi:SPOR domain-containing protein [Paenibacillus contaminans]|uniref:SPOR domain-containing protein n=1 Tax=Paenibacillus contaminans TaxID=450362 RepID=A0A329MQ64_9BACL|nr:hypothetical protein DQG23_08340 [Paenibacillus contaminans]